MSDKSREIHDMISSFPLEVSNRAIDELLTIVTALNNRIDELEAKADLPREHCHVVDETESR